MRKVYYIIAPTCCGKTTASHKLAKHFGIPLYHADHVYHALKKSYPITSPAGKLFDYRHWNDPEYYGLSSWGDHPDMDSAKKEKYEELLTGETGDFVIEGFTLSFDSERRMIKEIIGDHVVILLIIRPSYEQWIDFYISRKGDSFIPSERVFKRLNKCLELTSEDLVLWFSHPDLVKLTLSPVSRSAHLVGT